MTERRTVYLTGDRQRQTAHAYINEAAPGTVMTLAPATRTTEQNAKLWAQLGDISRQVEWYGKKLAPEDWKHVFSASLRKLSVVPNLDGTGFVALGLSTSRMGKKELAELLDLIDAFGSERGVVWSEPVAEVA